MKAARKSPKSMKRILLATDFSPASGPAVQRALEMASADGAALLIAYVLELPGFVFFSFRARRIHFAADLRLDRSSPAGLREGRMRRLLAKARRGGVRAKGLLLRGAAHDAIVRAARSHRVGRVVLGTRRPPRTLPSLPGKRGGACRGRFDVSCSCRPFGSRDEEVVMIRLRDVMREQVESISPNESAETAWARMRSRRIRHLVVLDKGQVVGVVSDRDLAGPGAFRQIESVGDVMSAPVVSGHPEMTLRQAANRLRGRSIGCLPVMEDDELVGILTTTDLLEVLGKGVERPAAKGKRWILKGRGPRRKPFVSRAARRAL